MHHIRKFLSIFLYFACSFFGEALQADTSNTVFIGAIINNDDQLISFFLKSLDNLEYDKKLIHVQMDICNNTESIKKLLSDWAKRNQSTFKSISLVDCADRLHGEQSNLEKNKLSGEIKDKYLAKSKDLHCSHCFILSSDVFINPGTLKYLIQKDKPILAPLLRPIPESNDSFRNFFFDATDAGYFKAHPDYFPIANREKLGTFKVPCVHTVYLIQTPFADRLSFTKNLTDYEFIAFSNTARATNVDQYICNEKEFGFFLHFYKQMALEEEKAFSLVGTEAEITPALLHSLLTAHYIGDPYLKRYANTFNFKDYEIFRIQNRDLFYLDDKQDYIKNLFLKKGVSWEEHINDLFKKHVKPGTVAIDIGGHIGTHTLNLSRIVGEKGTVHAFEPQAKMFCELAINMYLNGCKNVSLHHNALGAEEKWIEMFTPKEIWLNTSNADLVNEGHGTVKESTSDNSADKAKMITLDSLHLNNVSFMKIDVEGFEMDVIKGALDTIKRNKPTMIVEIFNSAEQRNKIRMIEDLGYTHTSIGGADFLFEPIP